MNILFIIAIRDFRDEEYFIPKNIFQREGFHVVTASTKKETAVGVYGGEVEIDLLYQEINIEDYGAIIFIGGEGALKYLDNEEFYGIIRKISLSGVVLGAICISPIILSKAGVLKGKDATVWSSPLERSPVSVLKEGGANYKKESVVCDGKIITANGPEAAEAFALKIIEALKQ